jgi:hypothetical protein
MAIKTADQISIVDVTDAYSVILTSDAHTFPGTTSAAKAGSCTTQIMAMRGAEQIAASVVLSEITAPSGVTVTKDNNTTSPTLTIAVTTSVTADGVVKIPVHIGDITINKEFNFAIAFTGATGSPGTAGKDGTNGKDGAAGADAITMSITSSNGTIFKNSAIETTLTAHVYKAGTELTATQIAALGTVKWYKDGGTTAVGTGATLTIDAGDVANKATYMAQLEG